VQDLKDKTAMCLVCGKKFPRGPLDLARHSTAVTLRHLTSKKQMTGYAFNCAKCSLFFTSKQHLDLHKQTACIGKTKAAPTPPASASAPSAPASAPSSVPASAAKLKPTPKLEKPLKEMKSSDEDGDSFDGDGHDRTLECMVCGKLFPRGPIDLARHATAITLKHLTHTRQTQAFPHGCRKCTLHFATLEHLELHVEQSSCSAEMVWPPSIAPGTKCVTKAEAAALEVAAEGARALGESSEMWIDVDGSEQGGADSYGSGSGKKAGESSKAKIDNKPSSFSSSGGSSAGGSSKSIYVAGGDDFQPRSKKARLLVPQERKAFFSVVSLLLDPTEVPEHVRLTESTYEAYVPARHKKLLNSMKAAFFYSC